jgi:hypothetical protein
MSQVTQLLTTAAVAVILTVVAMRFTPSVRAQGGRTAVCTAATSLASSPNWQNPEWMNAQLKAGKTEFVHVGALFCAW